MKRCALIVSVVAAAALTACRTYVDVEIDPSLNDAQRRAIKGGNALLVDVIPLGDKYYNNDAIKSMSADAWFSGHERDDVISDSAKVRTYQIVDGDVADIVDNVARAERGPLELEHTCPEDDGFHGVVIFANYDATETSEESRRLFITPEALERNRKMIIDVKQSSIVPRSH